MNRVNSVSTGFGVTVRNAPFEGVNRAIKCGTTVCSWIAGGGVLFLFALIFINVFLRYVFNQPLRHADELARYGNAWIAFFSLSYTFRMGRHIAIKVFTNRLPPSLRRKFETLGAILVTFWVALITYGGWRLWIDMLESKQTSHGLLEVQLWIPGLCIILGTSWFFLECFIEIIGRFVGFRSQE